MCSVEDSYITASVGLYAIQIAKYYGLNVITTCSTRHHDFVRSLGATVALDYRDAGVVENIKAAANCSLRYVFDTIGNDSSSGISSQAISEQGGILCTVRPGKAFTENVTKQTKVTDVLVWTAFLKEHKYKEFYWPVSSSSRVDIYRRLLIIFCSHTKKITSCRQSFSMHCRSCSLPESSSRIPQSFSRGSSP